MEVRGLASSLPRLLKIGAVAALSCLAIGQAPKKAQAQEDHAHEAHLAAPQLPTVKLGVPQLGPAPLSDKPAPFVCWAPGTPPATIAAYERTHTTAENSLASPFRTIFNGRWSRTATDGANLRQGQPTTITYSFVPEGLAIPLLRDTNDLRPSNLNARFNAIYGSQATWRNLFVQVAAAWSVQSGINIVLEPNDDGATFIQSAGQLGVRGDIRIAGRNIDGNGNGGGSVLAYNFAPDSGDMVIDTADSFFEDTSGNSLGFRNTATHEFGHGLGLGHTCPIDETKLMEPFVTRRFDGPQFDDILGMQRFYGDPIEDNDTSAGANNLGNIGEETVTRTNLSIDGKDDLDYFQFAIPVNKSISITVRPVGQPYLEGPQNDDGTCSAGTTFDPRNQNNLGFQLLQSQNGGFVPINTVDNAPAGGTETLAPTNIIRAGALQVRVNGDPTNDNIQRYALDITVAGPVTTPTPTPGPTAGPTPTPIPTVEPVPTATPDPSPNGLRPIVDLNGFNDDGSPDQDSPIANGIDNVSFYDYTLTGEAKTQVITPQETIVLGDISESSRQTRKGRIVEARVHLTPDAACSAGGGGQGRAPDNCNIQGKRDNEVLSIPAPAIKRLNDINSGLTVAYNNDTQVLTIKGGNPNANNDLIISYYEFALRNVAYQNKLPIPNTPFARDPSLVDRIITYTVDTDNEDSNNIDQGVRGRFEPQEGPGSNPLQSKIAVLTLKFIPIRAFGPGNKPSIIVTTANDVSNPNDGLTSLREAVFTANQTRTGNRTGNGTTATNMDILGATIRFSLGTGTNTINLQAPLPDLQDGVDIAGPGARVLTVRNTATASSSVFNVQGNSTISGLTISGGVAGRFEGTAFDIVFVSRGGGINKLAGGNLIVADCAITGNSAQEGGGIASRSPGNLTVRSSLISGNTSNGFNGGGGIYIFGRDGTPPTGPPTTPPTPPTPAAASSITNSTIASNTGGGIAVDTADLNVSLATVADNSDFGLSSDNDSVITVSNTIASRNDGDQDITAQKTRTPTNDDGTPATPQPAPGTFVSGGFNIIGAGDAASVAAFTAATNDRTGVTGNAAGLDILTNNGGNTDTIALRAGSQAINTGDPAIVGTGAFDQRGTGFPRVMFGTVDVGAFEKQNNRPVVSVQITPRNPGTNAILTATATVDEGATLTYRWQVNGTDRPGETNATYNLATPGNGDRGDVITVIVTATNAAGPSNATDSVTVGNTAPSFNVTITPRPNPDAARPDGPLTNDRVEAVTTVLRADGTPEPNNTDVDGDRVSFTYRWKVNGLDRPQETGRFLNLASPGNGDRDDLIEVFVTATDNLANGTSEQRSASTRVANTAPVVNALTLSVAPGKTGSILLRGTDADAIDANKLTFGFETPTSPNTLVTTKGTATISANSDGTFLLTYTANADARDTDVLRITVTDTTTTLSAAKTSVGNLLVKITELNRPPAVANTFLNAKREVPVSKVLIASDPDADDVYENLTLKRVSGPRKGTGEIRKDTDGFWKLFYKASGLFQGNDEVKFVAIDTKGAVSPVGTITINLFNTAPTARNTQMQVAAGGSADVGIFGADIDREELTFRRVGGPTKGSGEIRRDENGNFRFYYQNSPAATGDDQVRFVAIDSNGTPSEPATIDIKVVGFFNRAPAAENVTGTTTQGTEVSVAVAAADPDEGDTLTFKRVGGPTNGTGEIRFVQGEDVFKMFYKPRADFVGTEVIRYVAIDQKGRPSAPATITITVTATPSAPGALQSGTAPSADRS